MSKKLAPGLKTVDLSLYIAAPKSSASNGGAAAAPSKPESKEDFRARMDREALELAKAGASRRRIMDEIGCGEFQARKAIEAAKLIKAAAPGLAAADKPQTREEWLNAVALAMGPWFESVGAPLTKFRVSIGFPSKGAKGKAIGECWTDEASADKHHEIFIRPDRSDSVDVAAILAHELVHAAVGIPAGHGKAFKRVALAIGLEGKMKATVPGDKFKEAIAPILDKFGPIPHATLKLGVSSGDPKQTTRQIKCSCVDPGCEFKVRASRKILVEIGLPHCPKHGEMEAEADLSDGWKNGRPAKPKPEDGDEGEDEGGEDE